MQICYVIPGNLSARSTGAGELSRRRQLLSDWAFVGSEITAVEVFNGVLAIETAYDEILAMPGCVAAIRDQESQGIDATIVGCFADPGLDAARELVSIPVIGPGEASMLLAAQLGHQFSVIATLDGQTHAYRAQAFRTGVLPKLASVRGMDVSVLDLSTDKEVTFGALVHAGRRAITEDGADVLILGCMTLAFMNVTRDLSDELGVPVVNPAQAALKSAEVLVALGLAHSKQPYFAPRSAPKHLTTTP